MNTATFTNDPSRRPDTAPPVRHDLALTAALALLVALAWGVSQAGLFTAGDDLGYGLGVAGGVLMLLLLLYPARKYLRAMRNTGRVKGWFWFHMVCGIAGPWLILVHSTFRIGSLNAGVALFSMVIVVLSGVIGRFLFVRVQQQLGGGQATLVQRREQLGLAGSEARSMLAMAPDLEQGLRLFELRELPGGDATRVPLLQLLTVPLRHGLAQRRHLTQLDERLAAQAGPEGWSADQLRLRQAAARQMLRRYFDAVLRVAHYSLFDRLFALWHVAHLPFVVLLALSAVVHVVAVHAY